FSRPEQEGHGLRLRKDHFATVFLPLSSFYAVHSGNAAFPVAEGNSSGGSLNMYFPGEVRCARYAVQTQSSAYRQISFFIPLL
ncbi:hypothetical protein, partial [Phocaeicola sp.]|uniref:hypothetical protein n=1 Tax=Phocaeicola sp. TaxID=2773926 RepID=UPI002840183D